jgi:hypothetical protein
MDQQHLSWFKQAIIPYACHKDVNILDVMSSNIDEAASCLSKLSGTVLVMVDTHTAGERLLNAVENIVGHNAGVRTVRRIVWQEPDKDQVEITFIPISSENLRGHSAKTLCCFSSRPENIQTWRMYFPVKA